MMEVHQAADAGNSEKDTIPEGQIQREAVLAARQPNVESATEASNSEDRPNEKLVAERSLNKGFVVGESLAKGTLETGLTSQELLKKESTNKRPAAVDSSAGALPTEKRPSPELQASLLYKEQPKQSLDAKKQPQSSNASQSNSGVRKSGEAKSSKSKRTKKAGNKRLPRVVYIDDSPADSRAMSSIVEKLGYEYVNIQDPLQALPMLIELKPKLIFLDLVMPIANGYEVCAQIRRITAFKEIPVVIVTSNDGIADRVRAKLVGASGFMGKPIQEERILKVFQKYLPNGTR
ncbi:response regulator [cf. Phormidesmis sp. LEGE 11477]|nr:response regulator [cf. Phormidesmis sp. LEGE 11477]